MIQMGLNGYDDHVQFATNNSINSDVISPIRPINPNNNWNDSYSPKALSLFF